MIALCLSLIAHVPPPPVVERLFCDPLEGVRNGGLAVGAQGPAAQEEAAQFPAERQQALLLALDSLEGGSAEKRFLAARQLARLVEAGDGQLLLAAVRRGGPETRLRLVDALAGEDRHILIAAELLESEGDLPAPLGLDILTGLILRWNPEYGRGPLSRAQMVSLLGAQRARELQVTRLPSLAASIAALGRSATLGVPLVLDPALADGVRRGGREQARGVVRGTWDQVLDQLTLAAGATWEGFGFMPGEGQGPAGAAGVPIARQRPFVRVCISGGEGGQAGVDRLLEWCSKYAFGESDQVRRAAARALAASGWPAALHWLEARGDGDSAARSGLVLAASRGRLTPWFRVPRRLAALLAEADGDLAALPANGGAAEAVLSRVEELAAALARLPAPYPPEPDELAGPAPLLEPILADWESLTPRSLWLRLTILEGMRPAIPGLIQRVQAVAAAPGQPRLRLQALRTLAVLPGPAPRPFPLGRITPLLDLAGAQACVPVLVDSGAVWQAREGDMADPAARACLLAWALGRGDSAAAHEILEEDLAAGLAAVGTERLPAAWEPLFDVLEQRSIALERGAVRKLLSAAFGEAGRQRWPVVFARCALRAGCSSREEDLMLLEKGLPAGEMGRLICGQAHGEARAVVIAALKASAGAEREAWLEAVAVGVEGLRARLQDAAVRRLLGELLLALGEGDGALRSRIIDGEWPAPPAGGVVRVDLMSRWLW